MKMGEAEIWLRQQLQQHYDKSESGNIAAMVMEHLTGSNRLQRVSQNEDTLSDQQLHQLSEISQRLQKFEPVQYVLGEANFGPLKLFVDRSVLIPRPETEELVHWIVEEVKASGKPVFHQARTEADKTTLLKILDVGTGSGCIALLLKHLMPLAEVWGCDASDAALTIARQNGSELDIRVDFVGLDFLDAAQRKQLPTVDIIVSNPPYIPLQEKESLQPNVVAHEPHLALFVPDNDDLLFYKALAQFGHDRLYEGGAIYTEIHEDKGKAVAALFEKEGYKNVVVKQDMQGKDRMVKAEKP
jgi:release factor glutamine methyltransferase